MGKLNMSRMKVISIGVCVGVLVLLYTFYMYIVSPIMLKNDELKASIQQLEVQVEDVSNLGRRLEDVKKEVKERELEVMKMKNEMNYTPVVYTDFLRTLGGMQDKSGVEIISVKEDRTIVVDSHWEIPYNIVVSGSYVDILDFVNEFYKMDKFHMVTDIKLNNQNTSNTSKKDMILSMGWAVDIKKNIEKVYKKYPNVTDEDEAISKVGELKDESILQLDISLKFVSNEDPMFRR